MLVEGIAVDVVVTSAEGVGTCLSEHQINHIGQIACE